MNPLIKFRKTIALIFSVLFLVGFVETDVRIIENERPLAIVRRFKPSVSVSNASSKIKELNLEENIGEQLFSGDTLLTDNEGYALIVFMDNSIAKVKPNSMLVVRGETDKAIKKGNTRIDLGLGEIFLDVQPQGGNDFEVSTSRSLASVKGTQFGNTGDGYVWVKEGQVDVEASVSGETVSLFEKMFAQVNEQGDGIESGTLSDSDMDELEGGYGSLDENLIKKQMKIRFRDANGQIREVIIDYFEKSGN
ncbi:MAG: FecR family protein [Balneolaceae bacterium]